MKSLRVLPFVLFLFFAAGSYAQSTTEGIKWITVAEAEKLMKKKPKKVIVDIYTDWCGWCKKLDATTYKDPAVVEYINKNYYAVKFNAESKETISFKGKTYAPVGRNNGLTSTLMGNSTGYPTTTFLNEEMEVISPVPGYQNAQTMIIILKYFGEDHYKSTDWTTFYNSTKAAPQN